jgi:hypothetical protein
MPWVSGERAGWRSNRTTWTRPTSCGRPPSSWTCRGCPTGRVVVRFGMRDNPGEHYWLILRRPHPELCTRGLGHVEDVVAHTDSGCLVDIHLTRTSYAEAIREGRLLLAGPPQLTRTFPTRIRHSPFAGATPGTAEPAVVRSRLSPDTATTRLRARDRGRRRPTAAHAATRDGRMTGPAALPANRPTARGTTAVQSTGPATTKTTAEARVAHRAARSSSRSPREPGCRPARGAQPEA